MGHHLWRLPEMLSLHMGLLTHCYCKCNSSSEKEVTHPPKVIIHSALKTAIVYVNHSGHCISFPFKLVPSLYAADFPDSFSFCSSLLLHSLWVWCFICSNHSSIHITLSKMPFMLPSCSDLLKFLLIRSP